MKVQKPTGFFLSLRLLALPSAWAQEELSETLIDLKLQPSRRICHDGLGFKVSGSTSTTLDPYLVSRARSEEECARLCYEKLDFCNAAIFEPRAKLCRFSYKGGLLCGAAAAQLEARSHQLHDSVLIYCLKCDGDLELIKLAKPRTKEPENTTTLRTTTRSRTTTTSTTTTRKPTTRLQEITTRPTTPARPQEVKVTDSPRVTPRGLGLLERPDAEKKTNDGFQFEVIIEAPLEKRPGRKRVRFSPRNRAESRENLVQGTLQAGVGSDENAIEHQSLFAPETDSGFHPDLARQFTGDGPLFSPDFSQALITQPKAGCSEVALLPCSFGVGRDCEVVEQSDGCLVCSCPYKSPARGCLGPLFLSEETRHNLLNRLEPCRQGGRRFAQNVIRYYRKMDPFGGRDTCEELKHPYCGYLLDANLHRMPRTKDECQYFCFSEKELESKTVLRREDARVIQPVARNQAGFLPQFLEAVGSIASHNSNS